MLILHLLYWCYCRRLSFLMRWIWNIAKTPPKLHSIVVENPENEQLNNCHQTIQFRVRLIIKCDQWWREDMWRVTRSLPCSLFVLDFLMKMTFPTIRFSSFISYLSWNKDKKEYKILDIACWDGDFNVFDRVIGKENVS